VLIGGDRLLVHTRTMNADDQRALLSTAMELYRGIKLPNTWSQLTPGQIRLCYRASGKQPPRKTQSRSDQNIKKTFNVTVGIVTTEALLKLKIEDSDDMEFFECLQKRGIDAKRVAWTDGEAVDNCQFLSLLTCHTALFSDADVLEFATFIDSNSDKLLNSAAASKASLNVYKFCMNHKLPIAHTKFVHDITQNDLKENKWILSPSYCFQIEYAHDVRGTIKTQDALRQ
jgi:hypothetical protein